MLQHPAAWLPTTSHPSGRQLHQHKVIAASQMGLRWLGGRLASIGGSRKHHKHPANTALQAAVRSCSCWCPCCCLCGCSDCLSLCLQTPLWLLVVTELGPLLLLLLWSGQSTGSSSPPWQSFSCCWCRCRCCCCSSQSHGSHSFSSSCTSLCHSLWGLLLPSCCCCEKVCCCVQPQGLVGTAACCSAPGLPPACVPAGSS